MPGTSRLLTSVLIVGAAYAIGWVLKTVVVRRLVRWARRTTSHWDDHLTSALGRRLPNWALLIGIYLASDVWPLPAGVVVVLHLALFVLLVGSATFMFADLASLLAREYGHAGDTPHASSTLLQNIARVAVLTAGFLIVLNGLGVSITPLLTALGVGGLAIALALQDTLANLFAGFYVTLARQVRVGDYIRLDTGQEGRLDDIAWRAARLRTGTNNAVIVPNAKLAQAIVTNFDLLDAAVSQSVEVTVDHTNDLAQVEALMTEIAQAILREHPQANPSHPTQVRVHAITETGVTLAATLWAAQVGAQADVRHAFLKRLHDAFRTHHVKWPSPRTGHVS